MRLCHERRRGVRHAGRATKLLSQQHRVCKGISANRRELMAPTLHVLTLAAFAALMATAAIEDLRRLVIPNRLILGLFVLWPVDLVVRPAVTLLEGVEAAAGALAVFLGGSLLYSRRLFGGGDVKLLTAAALWAGVAHLPGLLLLTGLFGGALSLLMLTPLGGQVGGMKRAASAERAAAAIAAGATPVPYGAAIAGAALFVTLRLQSS
jgi:prepilin peptidase CpaA